MARLAAATSPAYQWGGAALFIAAAVILAALGFEFIGGYKPCPLCLQQRWAYYAGIPLMFGALILLSAEYQRWAVMIFLFVAFVFLANAGLGVYHAGAEWKFWPGPDTCAATGALGGGSTEGGVLGKLAQSRVIRCDEAPLRVAWLSFAGWNVVASLILFTALIKAASAATSEDGYL